MPRDTSLKTFRLDQGVALAATQQGPADPVTLESPALAVMTDLTAVKAVSTPPATTLVQAEQLMIHQGVRMLFVVSDMPSFEGLVTTTDLHGERQMRLVHERNLHYDELCVADVMTELSRLDAIDFDDMKTATVANLVATLQRFGRNHLLVVQRSPRQVRGVISRSQIERQLGAPVVVTPVATSFSEIEQALH